MHVLTHLNNSSSLSYGFAPPSFLLSAGQSWRHLSPSTLLFLSVFTQLGQQTAGWMGRSGGVGDEEEGSWVTFLPLGLCVCQPSQSQFSPGKLGGGRISSMCPYWTQSQPTECIWGLSVDELVILSYGLINLSTQLQCGDSPPSWIYIK